MAKQIRLIAVAIAYGYQIGTAYDLEKEAVHNDGLRNKENTTVLQEAISDGWQVVQSNSIGEQGSTTVVYTLIKEDKKEED